MTKKNIIIRHITNEQPLVLGYYDALKPSARTRP